MTATLEITQERQATPFTAASVSSSSSAGSAALAVGSAVLAVGSPRVERVRAVVRDVRVPGEARDLVRMLATAAEGVLDRADRLGPGCRDAVAAVDEVLAAAEAAVVLVARMSGAQMWDLPVAVVSPADRTDRTDRTDRQGLPVWGAVRTVRQELAHQLEVLLRYVQQIDGAIDRVQVAALAEHGHDVVRRFAWTEFQPTTTGTSTTSSTSGRGEVPLDGLAALLSQVAPYLAVLAAFGAAAGLVYGGGLR